jgi:hypothetical protein
MPLSAREQAEVERSAVEASLQDVFACPSSRSPRPSPDGFSLVPVNLIDGRCSLSPF